MPERRNRASRSDLGYDNLRNYSTMSFPQSSPITAFGDKLSGNPGWTEHVDVRLKLVPA